MPVELGVVQQKAVHSSEVGGDRGQRGCRSELPVMKRSRFCGEAAKNPSEQVRSRDLPVQAVRLARRADVPRETLTKSLQLVSDQRIQRRMLWSDTTLAELNLARATKPCAAELRFAADKRDREMRRQPPLSRHLGIDADLLRPLQQILLDEVGPR